MSKGGRTERHARSGALLEWLKVLLPVLISWPTVGLIVAVLFHDSLSGLIYRFSQSTQGKAELGPLKIELSNPVLPPQFRPQIPQLSQEVIDLSASIGRIGDTGPEGTTVGFAVAYAIQSATAKGNGALEVSARGIYALAKRSDEWPGEDYEGTSLLGALKAAKTVGVYSAKDWPYSSKALPSSSIKPVLKLSGFAKAKSIAQVLDALRAGNVVAATIVVTNDFDSPAKDGKVILKLPLDRQLGAKAVTIVGYDPSTAEFKFANDWGTAWGAKGFGRIKDTDLARILTDGYTVEL